MIDDNRGRDLYISQCMACHGIDGKGMRNTDGSLKGPSLIGAGAAAVDFQVGTGRMPAKDDLNYNRQEPRKPIRITNKEDIKSLANYIDSFGIIGPSIPYINKEMIDHPSSEELAEGGELYMNSCAACHNFSFKGGALSNGNFAVPILHDELYKYIYEAMITGPQEMPIFDDNNLPPEKKYEIIAYIHSVATKNNNPGGFALGRLGTTTEGIFGWTFGSLTLIGFAYWLASVKSKKR